MKPLRCHSSLRSECTCFDSMTAKFEKYLTSCQHCLFFHQQWKERGPRLQGLPPEESRRQMGVRYLSKNYAIELSHVQPPSLVSLVGAPWRARRHVTSGWPSRRSAARATRG